MAQVPAAMVARHDLVQLQQVSELKLWQCPHTIAATQSSCIRADVCASVNAPHTLYSSTTEEDTVRTLLHKRLS